MEIILITLTILLIIALFTAKIFYGKFSLFYLMHLRDTEVIAEYFSIYQLMYKELKEFDSLGAYEGSDEFSKFFNILRENIKLLEQSSIIKEAKEG